MDRKQSTDQHNKGKSDGTKVSSITPRDSSGTPPLRYGASGENATSGNRNKRS